MPTLPGMDHAALQLARARWAHHRHRGDRHVPVDLCVLICATSLPRRSAGDQKRTRIDPGEPCFPARPGRTWRHGFQTLNLCFDCTAPVRFADVFHKP